MSSENHKYAYLSKTTLALILVWQLASCATGTDGTTLASLQDVEFEVIDEKVTDSLEKAMASYQDFLQNTPETAMTPEALRRLADLKIQKEQYDEDEQALESEIETATASKKLATQASENEKLKIGTQSKVQGTQIEIPDTGSVSATGNALEQQSIAGQGGPIAALSESDKAFDERVGENIEISDSKQQLELPEGETAEAGQDLQTVGAMEAIEIYKNLLKNHPLFERNDQVVYQLSRAYEDTGQVDIAMDTIKLLLAKYPDSRHIDESQFRLAEYYFSSKKYLDAEESYQAVVARGEGSEFFELSLYKLGWSFFKQELYEEALHAFIRMLDYKIDNGFELDDIDNKLDKKRVEDTYRVISLSFSYLEGAQSVVEFFDRYGHRPYEASIYSHLGEYYFSKRRFADATNAYKTYVDRNPLSSESPYFGIRIIEIYAKGGFPKLVIGTKKDFAKTYSPDSSYWTYFDINEHPGVLAFIKSNLTDLANHYHALYQNKKLAKAKEENYREAINWYREFLTAFNDEIGAPGLNNQLAGLMLEHKEFFEAAIEYERTAYNYPPHGESASAGYAAIYAYREHHKVAEQSQSNHIKREIVRSSIRFFETFPDHKHAPVVLVAAVEDLYGLEDFERAILYGRRAIEVYPNADQKLLRSAWMAVAHSSFNTANYKDAENAYSETLILTDVKDESYQSLNENLAASVYKQGEQALKLEDHQLAADHFLRVAKVVPNSKIRPTAEYDAAASLLVLKQWKNVSNLLEGFRKRFPQHELLPDITKKLAIVYKEDGRYLLSAVEFERIERENPDNQTLRREALYQAAELYDKAGAKDKVLSTYQKLVNYFPEPIEEAIETRQKMADMYQQQGNLAEYLAQLEKIVKTDAASGGGRTDRTRYLAAFAALVLAEPKWEAFSSVALVQPFKKNLAKKKKRMGIAVDAFAQLVDYKVGGVTAAATYYLAEIYYDFNVSLVESERPTNLNDEELEQYELVIEEQAYPFEAKAIDVHEKNMELLDVGIYNEWIDKSIAKLAVLLPARYAKKEQERAVIAIIQLPRDIADRDETATAPRQSQKSGQV
jgi:tetratricopeptide (TPR) repeat protein